MSGERINAERINDRIKLIRHRLIARILVSDPGLIDRARTRIQDAIASGRAISAAHEWNILLQEDVLVIRRAIVSRSERMCRLRISSPLASLTPIHDEAVRRRMWKKARQGLLQEKR